MNAAKLKRCSILEHQLLLQLGLPDFILQLGE